MRRVPLAILPVLLGLLAGCESVPANPTFPLTASQARRELDAMARHPRPLARPVLMLGGYMDIGLSLVTLERRLRRVTGDERFYAITFTDCQTMEECSQHLVRKVQEHLPSRDPRWTTPVDVVAISMGGLVARYAATPGVTPRQLRIVRLFTICSPHRGAMLADMVNWDMLAWQMKPGSDVVRAVNRPANLRGYPIIPYVWTSDATVGAGNAAPPGQTPWWLPPKPLQNPHLGAMQDVRIAADIARRLRGEKPYTREPPAPLPPGSTATDPARRPAPRPSLTATAAFPTVEAGD